MTENFGTVLSIIGFYFSLVGLLGSLFFVHLGNWYKDISTTEQKWKRFKNLDVRDRHIECYLEAFDEKNPLSYVGFILLTSFMIILGVFAQFLRQYLPAEETLTSYMYLPIYLFFAIYFIASMIYLVLGYRKANRLLSEIDKKLS